MVLPAMFPLARLRTDGFGRASHAMDVPRTRCGRDPGRVFQLGQTPYTVGSVEYTFIQTRFHPILTLSSNAVSSNEHSSKNFFNK